jgi:hypothetical protein
MSNEMVQEEIKSVDSNKIQVIVKKLKTVSSELEQSSALEKDIYKERLVQYVREILKYELGLDYLYNLTPHIVKAGFFVGGGWEREDKLLPELVRGSFQVGGIYPYIEVLSELRMLCIYKDKINSSYLERNEAENFLTEVLALNLDILFDSITEESRVYQTQYKIAQRLFDWLTDSLNLERLFDEFSREIMELAYQRPIITDHIIALVESGKQLIDKKPELKERQSHKLLDPFFKSVYGPTPLSAQCEHPLDYRSAIKKLEINELEKEAVNFGALLKETGIGTIYGVILIRHLVKNAPHLVTLCLGLNDSGVAHFNEHQQLVLNIIKMAIRPTTSNTLYGLSCVLERHLLSQSAVLSGIENLVSLTIDAEVSKRLLKRKKYHDSITPNALIISGLISVLGQPLGIGQGKNPTCQAARGISLWSQYNPSYLIDLLVLASRNNVLEFQFEGQLLKSTDYLDTNSDHFDPQLDAVSLVLVPHLNVLYGEMLRRCHARGEDPHKWVNPAMYGRLVNFGFESVLDFSQTVVRDYENFVRRFYSTHHPEYSDANNKAYANPVGIFITNSHGAMIGLHAVSIQRVDEDESGQTRVYFFNPNNEGRQNWGQGVRPTVHGHDEIMGESSLPFDQFASRLYAYHFNPYEEGDGFAVPEESINKVTALAKSSWGKSYQWF